MATSFDPRNPRITSHCGIPQIVSGALEANSQSFKAGELVYFDASGAVAVCTASTVIGGIALNDATEVSASNAAIAVQIIEPQDEVLIRCASDTSGTLALSSTFERGTDYAVDQASNLWYANSSDEAAGQLTFISPVYDATGAATYWGRFKPTYNKTGSNFGS